MRMTMVLLALCTAPRWPVAAFSVATKCLPSRHHQLLVTKTSIVSAGSTIHIDRCHRWKRKTHSESWSSQQCTQHDMATNMHQSSLSSSSSSTPTLVPLMDWLQGTVVEVLNDLYSPAQVARGNALAKLEKQQSKVTPKKKKKMQEHDDSNNDVAFDNRAEILEDGSVLTLEQIDAIVQQAVDMAPASFSRFDAMVTPATRPEFGDYQVNAAMGLAKALGQQPRQCAQSIVDALQPKIEQHIQMPPEIAGPGFINLRIKEEYLSKAVSAMAGAVQDRLAIPRVAHKQRIVVDYSSPNIAKEMHVGHLRSTIIGDTIANLLEFVGHDVVRLNHVGDWGTQFGMLVEHLRDQYPTALDPSQAQNVDLGDLVVLYKAAKKRFDDDDGFRQRARQGVVRLQAGEPEALAAWHTLCTASRVEFEKIYQQLGIRDLQERGESFYNPYLSDVVGILQEKGLAVESDGALVVFLDGYTNRDGSPLPMIIRKSDGGYNYATTDLAAIRQRAWMASDDGGERADRVLYVTDAGQSQHFDMVFATAKLAGFVPEGTTLEHVPFGLVQGADGKKFATRSGETVKLKDLLNEAVHIAGEDMRSKAVHHDSGGIDAEALARIDRAAHIVGIGAVKYADLSMNRESNYRFSYERMLSMNGNTAPYMLYAYARICGIIRKASGQEENAEAGIVWPEASPIEIAHESELDLCRALVRLPDVIAEVERDLYPSRLCDYLLELSQKFNQFYENCSVVKAPTEELRASRLTLCTATAGTLRLLMNMLGIGVLEKF